MKTITFTCETITPMFLSGADGSTPELRPPSIKGALRFWWRAMNGHLSLTDLKKQEAEIFGGTDEKSGRSKVLVRMLNNLEYNKNTDEAVMLPHKLNKKSPAFIPIKEREFIIELRLLQNEVRFNSKVIMNQTKIMNLFVIICSLGGLGKRSRRGFGSIRIKEIHIDKIKKEGFRMPETLKQIHNYLDSSYFTLNANDISTNFRKSYPCIQKIEIGNKTINTLEISKATHKIKGQDDKKAKDDDRYKRQYAFAMGNGGRFASPIYTNLLEVGTETKAIITTLNTIPKEGGILNRACIEFSV